MHRICGLLLAAAAVLSLAGFAGGAASMAKLTVTPPLVIQGGTITIAGAGFRANRKVSLSIARPRSSTTSPIGSITTKANGRFVFRKATSRIAAGSWVVRACQASCRTKATATLRVSKIKPV
jgi:hypothetical protein